MPPKEVMGGIMYSLCRITECGDGTTDCCSADWANCPGTQTCGLDVHARDEWFGDPGYRAKYARHMGGANLGFADGHASWWAAQALETQTPYCDCTCPPTWHNTDGKIRGLCPLGLGNPPGA